MAEALLTMKDAATQLQFTDETIRSYVQQGKLKAYKIGRKWRFKQSDLDAYIESRAVDPGCPE